MSISNLTHAPMYSPKGILTDLKQVAINGLIGLAPAAIYALGVLATGSDVNDGLLTGLVFFGAGLVMTMRLRKVLS